MELFRYIVYSNMYMSEFVRNFLKLQNTLAKHFEITRAHVPRRRKSVSFLQAYDISVWFKFLISM